MSDFETILLKNLRQLPPEQQQALVDYSDFLCQRYAIEETSVPQTPADISRPQVESVMKAIRRLSKTYPMLESKEMFEKTSSFMMRNLMHGEGSETVIDEMEVFFHQSYQNFLVEKDPK